MCELPRIARISVAPPSAEASGSVTSVSISCGLRAHFIDHAFHLSGRPLLMLWTYGPATVANIALNLYVVPRYGMMGAAWTALARALFNLDEAITRS